MTMEQVEERLGAIDLEAEDADLEALSAEMDALQERKNQIIAEAEERQAVLDEVAEAPITEPIMEEERMEEKRTFGVETPEYRTAWLKSLQGKELDVEERAAMSTVDVIPTITENTIINRLKENDLLKYIDFTQIPGYLNIPNYTTNGDAAWATSNEQQDEIGHVSLSLYQLIKTVEFSAQFEKCGIDAFEAKLVEALVNKIESALQNAVIIGNGSSKPTGINVTHSTADGTFTKAGITKADLLKIMGKLPGKYQKDAVWIMPNKVFYEAMGIANIQNFVNVGDDLKKVIAGHPVITDDACTISSTDTIFYGASKAYHLNIGAPIEVARDTSVGFKSNMINYRAVTLADGKLDNKDAFVKYTRATA